MVVVEVEDHRPQAQTLLAAFGAAPQRVFEAIEQAFEMPWPDAGGVAGQGIHSFVGGPQGARGVHALEVFTEGLLRPRLRPVQYRLRQLALVVPDLGAGRIAKLPTGA